jgi:TPP-dependent pyruvate/acetoin dehydrogenase alpha subunit
LVEIEEQIERALDEAVEFALASGFPSTYELRRDVYATEVIA